MQSFFSHFLVRWRYQHLGATSNGRQPEAGDPFSFWAHLHFRLDHGRSAPAPNARGHQQRCGIGQGFSITYQNEELTVGCFRMAVKPEIDRRRLIGRQLRQ